MYGPLKLFCPARGTLANLLTPVTPRDLIAPARYLLAHLSVYIWARSSQLPFTSTTICTATNFMMLKTKTTTTLSNMIGMDIEDDTLAAPILATPESNQENVVPVKKRGGARKALGKRFTKAAPRRTSASGAVGKASAPAKIKAGTKRVPLKEAANPPNGDDTEEVDDFVAQTEGESVMEGIEKTAKNAKGGRLSSRKPAINAKNASSRSSMQKKKDGEFEYTPKAPRVSKAPRPNPSNPSVSAIVNHAKFIPETQVTPEIDHSDLEDHNPGRSQRLPQSTLRPRKHIRSDSRTRHRSDPRSRTGSVSDTDRATSDPALRRRLGDATRQLDNLTIKYNHLHDVGIKEAEANFEKLKAQSEARAKGERPEVIFCKRANAFRQLRATSSALYGGRSPPRNLSSQARARYKTKSPSVTPKSRKLARSSIKSPRPFPMFRTRTSPCKPNWPAPETRSPRRRAWQPPRRRVVPSERDRQPVGRATRRQRTPRKSPN